MELNDQINAEDVAAMDDIGSWAQRNAYNPYEKEPSKNVPCIMAKLLGDKIVVLPRDMAFDLLGTIRRVALPEGALDAETAKLVRNNDTYNMHAYIDYMFGYDQLPFDADNDVDAWLLKQQGRGRRRA